MVEAVPPHGGPSDLSQSPRTPPVAPAAAPFVEKGNPHGGAPGQLAKEMLEGGRPPGFAMGGLVSLISQGRDEEAAALVADLLAAPDAGDADPAEVPAGSTAVVPSEEGAEEPAAEAAAVEEAEAAEAVTVGTDQAVVGEVPVAESAPAPVVAAPDPVVVTEPAPVVVAPDPVAETEPAPVVVTPDPVVATEESATLLDAELDTQLLDLLA